MLMLLMYLMTLTSIATLMLLMPMLLNMLMKKWLEKTLTFECGMNLNSSTRKPFSLQFFLLMVLFIIFDVEIALILVIPISAPWSMKTMLFFTVFITVLSMGLMYEWTEGSLNWKL